MPAVTTLCMYRDVSGLFTSRMPEDFTQIPEQYVHETDTRPDNEDDLLYGDNTEFKMPTLNTRPSQKPKIVYNWWKKYLIENKPTYWLFIVRENSNLEIYSIPDFKLSFIVRNLCFGHQVLVDNLETVTHLISNPSTAMSEIGIQKVSILCVTLNLSLFSIMLGIFFIFFRKVWSKLEDLTFLFSGLTGSDLSLIFLWKPCMFIFEFLDDN